MEAGTLKGCLIRWQGINDGGRIAIVVMKAYVLGAVKALPLVVRAQTNSFCDTGPNGDIFCTNSNGGATMGDVGPNGETFLFDNKGRVSMGDTDPDGGGMYFDNRGNIYQVIPDGSGDSVIFGSDGSVTNCVDDGYGNVTCL